MKKTILLIVAALLLLTACGSNQGGSNQGGSNQGGANQGGGSQNSKMISFEAYIKEGENFEFSFNPSEAISYEALQNETFQTALSADNWRSFFDVKEVCREHYEYDDEGNPTDTFMKGSYYSIELLDDFYYVDNWSRNGLQFEVYIDGEETRVMTNEGITYDPVTAVYREARTCNGADTMLILTDFVNSWDDTTVERYTGALNNYEMLSAEGDLYLLNASAIEFKKYKDDIYYFVAYGSEDEYFVILIRTDDPVIDREKEYDGAVYVTSGYRENERYTGYKKIVLWEMIIELMKYVNE